MLIDLDIGPVSTGPEPRTIRSEREFAGCIATPGSAGVMALMASPPVPPGTFNEFHPALRVVLETSFLTLSASTMTSSGVAVIGLRGNHDERQRASLVRYFFGRS